MEFAPGNKELIRIASERNLTEVRILRENHFGWRCGTIREDRRNPQGNGSGRGGPHLEPRHKIIFAGNPDDGIKLICSIDREYKTAVVEDGSGCGYSRRFGSSISFWFR